MACDARLFRVEYTGICTYLLNFLRVYAGTAGNVWPIAAVRNVRVVRLLAVCHGEMRFGGLSLAEGLSRNL